MLYRLRDLRHLLRTRRVRLRLRGQLPGSDRTADVHGWLHHLRYYLPSRRDRISIHNIRQVIRKNKIVAQAKNMLRADPEKYDVKKRALAGV
jgi:hypothetical protein